MNAFRQSTRKRRGVILVLSAMLMVVVFAMAAMGIDVGYMMLMRTQLQVAADAGALAAANVLHLSRQEIIATGEEFVAKHKAGSQFIGLQDATVELGIWDADSKTFEPVSGIGNAVRVTARRENANYFFARVLGLRQFDLEATAVAMATPRDIAFVVDLSGSMNDDTEPAWATSTVNAAFSSTVGTDLMQQVYADFGFGSFPGTLQYIGSPLGVRQASTAYRDMTAADGPLADGRIPAQYRIAPSDSETARKRKAYSWLIDYQIAQIMPAARPAPDSSVNYSYWEKYLDYIVEPVNVTLPPSNTGGNKGSSSSDNKKSSSGNKSGSSSSNKSSSSGNKSGGSNKSSSSNKSSGSSNNSSSGSKQSSGSGNKSSSGSSGKSSSGSSSKGNTGGSSGGSSGSSSGPIGRIEPRPSDAPLAVLHHASLVFGQSAAADAAMGAVALYLSAQAGGAASARSGWLPPNQDTDRIDQFNNPNPDTFPNADRELPARLRNWIGYLTYVQFMMDYGRNLRPDEARLVPLSVDSGQCPLHSEGTAGGTLTFPPREQPMHACRRSLIAALATIEERNSEIPDTVYRDYVSLVAYDTVAGTRVVQPLTGDYEEAMQSCTLLQAVGDKLPTTATEAGLGKAAKILRPKSEGGQARDYTDKVAVLLTDGVPNVCESSNAAINNYVSAHPEVEFYGGDDYAQDAALIETMEMHADRVEVYPVGIGLGADYDFMDRVARAGGTAGADGCSPRGSGDPAEYEKILTEIFRKLVMKAHAKLVE